MGGNIRAVLIGLVVGLLLIACVAVALGGALLWRQVARQQQAITELRATAAAASLPSPVPPAATPTVPAPAPPVATPTLAASVPPTAATAVAVSQPAALEQALAPEAQADLAAFPRVNNYVITATLDPERSTIAGEQSLRLVNTEGVPLDALYLRLYVNAPHYGEGGIVVEDVRVGGQATEARLEVNDTALRIALPAPLAPGDSAEVALRFTTTVPRSGGGYGIFNMAYGVWALYNWHPELAVYENGGWLLHPIGEQGDPTNTDVANYRVRFTAPSRYQIISSGVETPISQGASVTHDIVGALTRNMVLVVSDRFEVVTQQVGPATVSSYFLPEHAPGGQAALDVAAESLARFQQRFGPYPYAELDVAEVSLGVGAAATGLIMIGSDYYDPEQGGLGELGGLVEGLDQVSALGFITAHEVAHQWWYGVVGSDAHRQPWLDEGLTNWSAALFVDETAGAEAGALARDLFIGFPYRMLLITGDERLDQPVDAFNQNGYGAVVYGKGALMYDVLRQELGDEVFFDFLRRYYAEHRYGRVDGDDWRAALAQVAGADRADAFYARWVQGNAIDERDLPPAGPLSRTLDDLQLPLPTPRPNS
jgi:hypothetical protein